MHDIRGFPARRLDVRKISPASAEGSIRVFQRCKTRPLGPCESAKPRFRPQRTRLKSSTQSRKIPSTVELPLVKVHCQVSCWFGCVLMIGISSLCHPRNARCPQRVIQSKASQILPRPRHSSLTRFASHSMVYSSPPCQQIPLHGRLCGLPTRIQVRLPRYLTDFPSESCTSCSSSVPIVRPCCSSH